MRVTPFKAPAPCAAGNGARHGGRRWADRGELRCDSRARPSLPAPRRACARRSVDQPGVEPSDRAHDAQRLPVLGSQVEDAGSRPKLRLWVIVVISIQERIAAGAPQPGRGPKQRLPTGPSEARAEMV